ncbi:MAG: hypothetical protein HY319_09975 [Armatimonadetes bacterium]|nr:hypothetical protein [Armatimonadota bacterium]
MAGAMDIVHYFKPREGLDRSIYKNAVGGGASQEHFRLSGVTTGAHEVVLQYEIHRIPGHEPRGEAASLGALALTSALFVRALITRQPGHWAGALAAGSVAALGMQDMVKKARSAIRRFSGPGHLGWATVRLTPQEMTCTYGGQEVHIPLAPMSQVVMRTFQYRLQPPRVVHGLYIDLDDGRFLPIWKWTEALAPRRTGHQLARTLGLSMVFQNVEVTEVDNGFSWELGPVLSEPAMN